MCDFLTSYFLINFLFDITNRFGIGNHTVVQGGPERSKLCEFLIAINVRHNFLFFISFVF